MVQVGIYAISLRANMSRIRHMLTETIGPPPATSPRTCLIRRGEVSFISISGSDRALEWAKYNSLPAAWKIEVIRLCSKQKSIHLHEAERLAAKHRITALDHVPTPPLMHPPTHHPLVYATLPPDHPDQPANAQRKRRGKNLPNSSVGRENASANEGVNTTTHKFDLYASAPEKASINEGVRPCVLSTRKQADEVAEPSSAIEKQETEMEPSVTPENDPQYQREQAWLASEAHQRYLKIRAECLAQMNPGRASSPGPSCGGAPPQPGPTKLEPPGATENATNPVRVRQSWGPRQATVQQDLGRASLPGPSAAKAAPGPTEVEPLTRISHHMY